MFSRIPCKFESILAEIYIYIKFTRDSKKTIQGIMAKWHKLYKSVTFQVIASYMWHCEKLCHSKMDIFCLFYRHILSKNMT